MGRADRTTGTPAAGGTAVDRRVIERARVVRLLTCDVDGVLTDGRIVIDDTGRESKAFHALDGVGFKRLAAAGVTVAWITGSASASVEHRARMLGIADLVRGADDKLPAWERLRTSLGLEPAQCAHIGDDIPDLPVLLACGLAASVPGAPDEVRRHAHYVTRRAGGHGAARELADLIVAARASA